MGAGVLVAAEVGMATTKVAGAATLAQAVRRTERVRARAKWRQPALFILTHYQS
jgi:hypothetical protein